MGKRLADLAPYFLIVGAMWLAWQMIAALVVERGPPGFALRANPSSAVALRRAAEAELVAGRTETAGELARLALAKAPFDVRALRVAGLVEARDGSPAEANEMLTLAGNWSLRDDPTHAWLVDYRLRRGDYSSAFAHADTLVRRREDIRPQVFRLFTEASRQDPRALAALTGLVAKRPPWRRDYLRSLYAIGREELMGSLALALQRSEGPLTDEELSEFYMNWATTGRIPGLLYMRDRLNRPDARLSPVDGSFSTPAAVAPFGWMMGSGPGLSVAITNDDSHPTEMALRVEYDGYGPGQMVQQLVTLKPGRYSLSGRMRSDRRSDDLRMQWQVACLESGASLGLTDVRANPGAPESWRRFTMDIAVPAERCSAQWLRLVADPGDRRTSIVAWFDDIRITQP